MPPVGFERAIPVSELPRIHAFDSVATGIGLPKYGNIQPQFIKKPDKLNITVGSIISL
jgi:hypothetical protein